jgi:hypothetical protein
MTITTTTSSAADTTPSSTIETVKTGTGTDAKSTTTPSSAFSEFVLGHLRCARIRMRLALNAIDAAGVALKSGLIDGEGALAILGEAGLLPLIEASS